MTTREWLLALILVGLVVAGMALGQPVVSTGGTITVPVASRERGQVRTCRILYHPGLLAITRVVPVARLRELCMSMAFDDDEGQLDLSVQCPEGVSAGPLVEMDVTGKAPGRSRWIADCWHGMRTERTEKTITVRGGVH